MIIIDFQDVKLECYDSLFDANGEAYWPGTSLLEVLQSMSKEIQSLRLRVLELENK